MYCTNMESVLMEGSLVLLGGEDAVPVLVSRSKHLHHLPELLLCYLINNPPQ